MLRLAHGEIYAELLAADLSLEVAVDWAARLTAAVFEATEEEVMAALEESRRVAA